jgi:NADP-dependent 3-hydroxy acid dehydrogenase YdfG
MKKKIAITGHTLGIGAAIGKMLSENNYEVIGFSRANGYDISNLDMRNKLIESIDGADIFINNAYSGWAQTELLFAVFTKWKNLDKHIINIGSMSGDGVKSFVHKYAIEKSALDIASMQLNNIDDAKCRVSNIRPGWVKTKSIEHLNVQSPMLDPNEVAKTVEWLIQLPHNINISTLSIFAK